MQTHAVFCDSRRGTVKMIALTDAARLLGWRYWRTRDALLAGQLRGTRTSDDRYKVEVASVHALLARAAGPATAADGGHI